MDMLAASIGVSSPEGAVAVAVIYPPLKGELIREVKQDASKPGLTRNFMVEWNIWAMDEVRKGSDVGKVLAPYVKKYLHLDPNESLADEPAVKQSFALYLAAKNGGKLDELLAKLAKRTR